METEGKTMSTARMRLAAIAAAHRLGGHEDSTTLPLVKATMKRMAREYGKPRKQAKGFRLLSGFEGARRITGKGCGHDKQANPYS